MTGVTDLLPGVLAADANEFWSRLARLPVAGGTDHCASPLCTVALAAALFATPSAAQAVDFGKYPDFKGQ
jgi:hypothetical protein